MGAADPAQELTDLAVMLNSCAIKLDRLGLRSEAMAVERAAISVAVLPRDLSATGGTEAR